MTQLIKLEVGKKYVLNNGEAHTCYSTDGHEFKIDRRWYDYDGRCLWCDHDHPLSVSHEYPPQEGTLSELGVKEGDVVEVLTNPEPDWIGERCEINASGAAVTKRGKGLYQSEYDERYSRTYRLISRASDAPTLWRDMTPEEKGALLLAKHEGRDIEEMQVNKTYPVDVSGSWLSWSAPPWEFNNNTAYRIKPTPKVETVKVCENGAAFDRVSLTRGYRITFKTIDGKPDPASIKMEEL